MKHKKRNLIFIVAVAALALLMSVGFFATADDETVTEQGDFAVTGEHAVFDEENGVLKVTGDTTVTMKDGAESTNQSIIVSADCKLTLNGVNITAAKGPAILIESPYNVEMALANGSENYVKGANGKNINATAGSFAGIEVEFEFEDVEEPANRMASLTITGSTGKLTAESSPNAAGIGGSNSGKPFASKGRSLYGNITIDGGDITAIGNGAGAGIGSGNNPNGGTSIGSFKTTGNNKWGTITINGGTINATGAGEGAGIGGGNHVDSGAIIINGGDVTAMGAAGIGCGIGSSKNKETGADKGPGHYFATVEINGGTIKAGSNDIGAAIGGGMYCDAIINITGGDITAIGGTRQGNTHHGGAGIGGGYLGHADITISGGNIDATGGDGAAGIGSGGSPNSTESRGVNGRSTREGTVTNDHTTVAISGGDIHAVGGPKGGAGIGLGTGGDKAEITITGGTILAEGAKSDETAMRGGAGIGSGFQGTGSGSAKYFHDADVDVTITGGNVVAIGGWGASGVGSGADNIMAGTVTISAKSPDNPDGADLQAYSDGTKFAIDTRILDGDTTTSQANEHPETRPVDGYVLQGTYVHQYDTEGDRSIHQNPEGLKSILITNDRTGEEKELTLMPDSYRSYATNVDADGLYTVYTDAESIGEGEGRYFSTQHTDQYDAEEAASTDNGVQYVVNPWEAGSTSTISDNFYLFPVKTVVVEKIVNGPEEGTEGLNETVYFALNIDTEVEEDNFIKVNDKYFMKNGDAIWTESIDIVDGVPQGKAYFVNVDDRSYDIWEINGPDDTGSPQGGTFGSYELKSITTQHGGLIKATADGTTKGAFTVTKSDEGDKVKISAEVDFDKTEGQDWITVSLFADGKLSDESSKSLSKDGDHTATWTVDKEKDGEEIVYSVADTSNNAAISKDQWSDEVKIINTYTTFTPPVDVSVDLTKELAAYYKASKDARATAVFRVIVTDEANKKLVDRYVSFVFDKAGEQTKSVAFKKLEGPVKLTIEEVYSSGYKGVLKGGTSSKAEYDLTKLDLSKPVTVEATFVNTHEGKNKYTDGVINNYKNKQFDHKEGE